MIRLTLMFLIAALIAGVFGFGGLLSHSTEIAQVLFYIFGILMLISFIILVTNRRAGPGA